MALAEVPRMTHSVRDEVKVVDSKVESVEGKVVEDIGDKVRCIDEKVQLEQHGAVPPSQP
jgi:hypothetical protein